MNQLQRICRKFHVNNGWACNGQKHHYQIHLFYGSREISKLEVFTLTWYNREISLLIGGTTAHCVLRLAINLKPTPWKCMPFKICKTPGKMWKLSSWAKFQWWKKYRIKCTKGVTSICKYRNFWAVFCAVYWWLQSAASCGLQAYWNIIIYWQSNGNGNHYEY